LQDGIKQENFSKSVWVVPVNEVSLVSAQQQCWP